MKGRIAQLVGRSPLRRRRTGFSQWPRPIALSTQTSPDPIRSRRRDALGRHARSGPDRMRAVARRTSLRGTDRSRSILRTPLDRSQIHRRSPHDVSSTQGETQRWSMQRISLEHSEDDAQVGGSTQMPATHTSPVGHGLPSSSHSSVVAHASPVQPASATHPASFAQLASATHPASLAQPPSGFSSPVVGCEVHATKDTSDSSATRTRAGGRSGLRFDSTAPFHAFRCTQSHRAIDGPPEGGFSRGNPDRISGASAATRWRRRVRRSKRWSFIPSARSRGALDSREARSSIAIASTWSSKRLRPRRTTISSSRSVFRRKRSRRFVRGHGPERDSRNGLHGPRRHRGDRLRSHGTRRETVALRRFIGSRVSGHVAILPYRTIRLEI